MGADSEADSPLPSRKPQPGNPLPSRTAQGSPLPGRTAQGSPLPSRTAQGSPSTSRTAQGSPLPGRTAQGPALPVRTTRYRRPGRHSSPHQLSLPADAPTLVIAVPGAATGETEHTVAQIAEAAGESCPGAGIRAGYLDGARDSLHDVLAALAPGPAGSVAVLVPLLAFGDPQTDAAIAAAAAQAPLPCVVAQPLGPHPLLAEVLHIRLAEAGLARSTRVGRISVVTAADGVIVGAVGGEAAVAAAGVEAVLLASRLTVPVAAAPLTGPAAIREAAEQLRSAHVGRIALAPCVVGPEIDPGALAAISAQSGVACAAPLGGHRAVGQLVAIRYGAALEDPKLASLAR